MMTQPWFPLPEARCGCTANKCMSGMQASSAWLKGTVVCLCVLKRVLAERCRAAGMLLVFDEIFSGLWRLGTPSAWQRLRVRPDIACYAKLLTGAQQHAFQPGSMMIR